MIRSPTTTMAEEKTVPPQTTNEDENDTQVEETENEESQTDEAAEDTSTEGEDVENKEGDYYEEELKRLKGIEEEQKRLEKENAEQKRIIEIKNRALQAEKKKVRPQDAPIDRESLKKELLTEMRFETELERTAATSAERDVIKHHYQNSIVRTGNVTKDIQNARAVANASRLQEILSKQNAEDAQDDESASSMLGGGMRGANQSPKMKTQTRKEAEKTLGALNSSDKDFQARLKKNLDKYLPR